jgi:hypothetical protein
MQRIFYIVLLILFLWETPIAQPGTSDPSSDTALYPVMVYYQNLGEQSPLYNGKEYIEYAQTLHMGHPFYYTTEFTLGTIFLEGMIFDSARILYDIVKDKVILLHYNQVFKIDLPVKKIQQFIFNSHHFIRLYPDSTTVIEEGFYDRVYKGKMTVFVKRQKIIREERTGTEINRVVDEKDLLYIYHVNVYKENVYNSVNTRRELWNVLGDRKQEIQQYLKKNGVKFRKQREKAVVMAAEYYDRISK